MKTKRVLLLMVLYTAIVTQCFSQTVIGRQLVDQYPTSPYNTSTYGLTWLPAEYSQNTTQKYPLIIFLHGSGEGGDGVGGLYTLITQGLPRAIANGLDPEATNPVDGQRYKFIVVSPQAPWSMHWSYGFSVIQNVLADVVARYRVDLSRIYVTGLSAGGSGTYSTVTNGIDFAQKIAAIVPICPAGTNSQSEFDQLPLVGGTYGVKVWSPVGSNDALLNFAQTTVNTINNATPAPAVPAMLTIIPGVTHEPAEWNPPYDTTWRPSPVNLNIYEWMLQYKRTTSLPSASAGNGQTITLPVNQVTLNGSGTAGSGNTITSYAWTQVSGPSAANIQSASNTSTLVTAMVQGTYVFAFTVTNNLNVTATSQVTVVVNPAPNIIPVVNAGPDQDITLPVNSVTLTGSATDADGSIVSWFWNKIAGPASYNLTNFTSAVTNANNLAAGVYLFELTATDNSGASVKDTVVVTVHATTPPPNQPPVASAGADQNITLPVDSVLLSGSGTDADGTIASYNWTKISGPAQFTIVSAAQAQTQVKNLVQGNYLFEIRVTDNNGGFDLDTVSITVNAALPGNIPLVAFAGNDMAITLPADSVLLNGSGTDADGTIASYSWTKISGPASFTIAAATQQQTMVNNLAAGTYLFELSVTDNNGSIAKDTVQVQVNAAVPSSGCNGIKRYMLPGGDGGKYINADPASLWFQTVNPGDTLILTAQHPYSYFSMEGYSGTASCPIVVINEGGQVWLTSGISARNCRNIKITGTGANNSYYGFKVYNPGTDLNGVAICLTGKSSVIEVERVDVYKKTYGVWAKQDPMCDTSYNYPNYIMDSIEIHHSRFRNIGQDCIYAGNTDPLGTREINCGGVIHHYIPMRLSNINIHHLIIDSCNRTGIQLSGASGGYNQIHDNLVTRCGYEYNQWQGTGIAIGGMTRNCHVYNNTIKNTFLYGIMSFGVGTNYIENNTVDSTGYLDGLPNMGSQPSNIMVSPKETIPFDSTTIIIRNNRLGRNSTTDSTNVAVVLWGPPTYTINNVVCSNTKLDGITPALVYVDPNVHYIGNCSVALPNIPPVANAGPDQLIVTPGANSAILSGTGSDADGSVIAYNWSIVSGPSQFTIANPSQAQTDITGLVPGEYTFRLTVTDDDSATSTDDVVITITLPNVAPVANAGPDQIIALPLNMVTLNGSGLDYDGTITSFQWTKIGGPAAFNITSPSSAVTTVTGLAIGFYYFELRVTDNNGIEDRDTIMIRVNPQPPVTNIPPVANAGPNQVITLPTDLVTLNGSGADADGTVVSYLWSKLSGPVSYTLSSYTDAQTVLGNLTQGTYQFILTVTDNQGSTGKDTVTITVLPTPNVAPVANAGPDKVITLPVNTVTFSGSASDVDGTVTTYQWTKISGPASFTIVTFAQPQTVINGLVQGVYQFELRVADNNGAMDRDTVMVTVNAQPNIPPFAHAGNDQVIQLPLNSVTLNGSGTDADGTISAYQWTKISGPSQFTIASTTQASTVFNNLVQGVYQLELKVTDNQGATAKDTVVITVTAANVPPVAHAGNDQVIQLPVNSVTLNGSGTDADGTISAYQWTKISGPSQFVIASATQASTVFNNLVQGVYQVELKVTDNQGATAKDTVVITVNAVNIPPVSNAGPDQVITLPVNSVTLLGSGSDADGNVDSYQWSKISGPSTFTIGNSSSAQTIIHNLVAGVYQFELTVTDNQGATAKDTVKVTVNAQPPAGNIPPVAYAGADKNLTLPLNQVTLYGSGTDVDGTIVSYSWTKISGPAQYVMGITNQPQAMLSGLVEGTYHFELKVTDNNGATARDTVSVIVSPEVVTFSTAVIYPNPARSTVNIKIDAVTHRNMTSLRIYDAKGAQVYNEEFLRTQQIVVKQVDVSSFQPGVYLVVVNVDINTSHTMKFVKE